MKNICCLVFLLLLSLDIQGQHHDEHTHNHPEYSTQIEAQPLLAQALRVGEALTAIGSALPTEAINQLKALKQLPFDEKTVEKVQQILDPYCLAVVEINPETRVSVIQGTAQPQLMQEGWTTFLVKVHNQAHITAALVAESPNSQVVLHRSTGSPRMKEEHKLTPGQLDSRFLQLTSYQERPLKPNLSGLGLEYAVIQIYTREKGQREAKISFNVGQGTADIGFRNDIDVLFTIKPAVKVVFKVKDPDNAPQMASFIITDGIERFRKTKFREYGRDPWLDWEEPGEGIPLDAPDTLTQVKKLRGIYPLPSKRLASRDVYPDFYFQPQVYRSDGEYVNLPPGKYSVLFGRGPEYLFQEQEIEVPENATSIEVDFQLKRWINMEENGWYSADHHIHAAGCSHYESPEEGVLPEHMWRQILGEDLNLGSNLTWGPGWYHQKQYFTGKDHPLSNKNNLLRYDVEVSGFPSSHAGHLVLLNLKEDDYPNTTEIEEWPSWTLPVLQWAKEQGGITGYAHSGWGLAPIEGEHIRYRQESFNTDLPDYAIPRMDGIGANEYVVTVTHDAVDIYSLGNTPLPNEMNMWYHSLNCGFKTRISGETDFPCITDERVGLARTYAKLEKGLNFPDFIKAIKMGKSYVSDGYSHLIDFKINETFLGEENSELAVSANSTLDISLKAAAYLNEIQNEKGVFIASRSPTQQPYWNIERARVGSSRKIPIELIVNGIAVEEKLITADGKWNDIAFNYKIEKSSWVAIRAYASSHTNPIFVIVDGKPIRDAKSAAWCREAVDQCWKMKHGRIRENELEAARDAYDHAREIYDQMIENTEEERQNSNKKSINAGE